MIAEDICNVRLKLGEDEEQILKNNFINGRWID